MFTHQVTDLLQRLLKDANQHPDEEIHNSKACREGHGASMPSWSAPFSLYFHMPTNLEALQTLSFRGFMETSLLWKLVKENLTKVELGGSAGGAFTSYSSSITNPTGREEPCKLILLYYLSRKKEVFFFLRLLQQPSQWERVTTQPARSPYTSKSHNRFYQLPLSSIKKHSSLGSPNLLVILLVPGCNFLLC